MPNKYLFSCKCPIIAMMLPGAQTPSANTTKHEEEKTS
jgi:hypothetical protein